MIAIRIPEEIRKYKERIMFGLSARQLICTIIALLICVPLYFFGRSFINEELLSWTIILIAGPVFAIGFIKYNGMPMEKFAVAIFKYLFLYPTKRKYKTENAFRIWDEKARSEEKPMDKQKEYENSLERAVLLKEAEENGTEFVDEIKSSTSGENSPQKPKKDKNDNKKNQNKDDKKEKSKLQLKAEEIENKIKENPYYVPTNKENKTLKTWREQELSRRKAEIAKRKKELAKKNTELKKRKTVKTTIPRTTQQTIPYIADYVEGIFEVAPNKYSKMYLLRDVNYIASKEDERETIFCKYGEFLNYFSEDMNVQICVDNRIVSKEEQEKQALYRIADDAYDKHREEYNKILRRQIMAGRNDIQVEKYVVVTIDSATAIEALYRFRKIDNDVKRNLEKIGADSRVLSTNERLSYYHDKFRRGHEGEFRVDYDFLAKQGLSSKDYISPTSFEFTKKHFIIDDTYCRVMHLTNLPASLSDEFLHELCDNDFPLTTTINVEPVSQEKGLKIVKRQLSGIQKDKLEAEKKASRDGYSPEVIRHSIKDAFEQAEILYDDMLNKNQKMFFVTITCMVQGNSLEELDRNCKVVEGKARKYTCQMMTLSYQQEEGMKITLPFGYVSKEICVDRALTTESTAVFIPFSNQELYQKGGYYYGLNQISRNLILVDRFALKTPSGFVLGKSGSGKSFSVKQSILNVMLHDSETNVLVIDPENEYGDFARAFGGTVLKISSSSNVHINPMDMEENYGLDENDSFDLPIEVKKDKAIKKKAEYVMSIVERMISIDGDGDRSVITPTQKTIVDRCVYRCYKDFLDHDFDQEYIPTLLDLQAELDKEKDSPEGKAVAEGVEYYTKGSMNLFSKKTNVDLNNRFVVFNIKDLGTQLQQIGSIVVFDFIWNRMVQNKNRNIKTCVYCDEIHVLFHSLYSANYLKQLYKRGRKYGLCITGITQNVEDLLKSEQARGMIGNSEFVMMLNQHSEDLDELKEMLNISDELSEYVKSAEVGSGLLYVGGITVPFIDRFPVDSYLYKLMSTKFGENMTDGEVIIEVQKMEKKSKRKFLVTT